MVKFTIYCDCKEMPDGKWNQLRRGPAGCKLSIAKIVRILTIQKFRCISGSTNICSSPNRDIFPLTGMLTFHLGLSLELHASLLPGFHNNST